MFNKGEIDIFRRTGLQPVFFGSNIIGTRLPSLTYLLVFEDMAARERNWPQFVNHPDWKALVATPGYSDAEIVTNTHSFILRPTATRRSRPQQVGRLVSGGRDLASGLDSRFESVQARQQFLVPDCLR